MNIEYRELAEFPGYRFGDDGSLWGCRITNGTLGAKWRRLAPRLDRDGYLRPCLREASGNPVTRLLHRLILEAFIGPCPEGMECRHLDGNPANNRLENLAWATPKENHADKIIHGTSLRGRTLSSEHRIKIGQANRGKVRSPEARAKMSASMHGRVAWNKGKPRSPETRAKIAESLRRHRQFLEPKPVEAGT